MSTLATPLPTNEKSLNRREFLYYLGGASIALMTAGTCGGALWYTLPDPHRGEITADIVRLNRIIHDSPYISPVFGVQDAQAYIAVLETGMIALYGVCPHELIIVRWVSTNYRYECPNCGSKYRLDGSYIEGPAPRSLDRFELIVTYIDGTTLTSSAGSPLDYHNVASIMIDTNQKILGAPR